VGTPVSHYVAVQNTPPTIDSVAISPDPAYVTDSLDCNYAGYEDADGNSDLSTVEWLINGVSAANGTSLSSGYVKGDTVKCKVTPSDGIDEGTKLTTTIDISNTAPVASGVAISPAAPTVADTLDCSYLLFDADGDADASTIEWTVGGASVGTGASLASGFVSGDEVVCTVTPDDGEDAGAAEAASVVIGNSFPSVSGVTISPDPGYASDTLTCTYSFDDPDGDADLSEVEWFVNTVAVTTGATLAGSFSGGDLVECWVIPSDGTASGGGEVGLLTIANTPPEVTAVTVQSLTDADGDGDSSTASANDTLECLWTYIDADGDADASTMEWTDGAGTSLGSTPTLSGVFAGGDTVTCTVTPSDGVATAALESGDMLIGNTAPEASAVTVLATTDADGDGDSTSFNAADTLECSWTFADSDGDGDASTVEWTDDTGASLGSTTTLSGVFATGDDITCTVTPSDGTLSGTPASVEVTIENSSPSVSGVTVLATTDGDGDGDAGTAIAADTLECTWTFADVDGGSDQSTAEWKDSTGASLGTGSTLSGAFTGGDTVYCFVLPNDGFDVGLEDFGSILIGNTAPTVSDVTITATTNLDGDGDSSTAVTGDELACAWTFSDVDGDGDSSIVNWTDEKGDPLGSGATLIGGFTGANTVTCTVTPNDGDVSGASASADLDIDNTAPTVSDVTILATTNMDGDGDSSTFNAADTLECSWTFDDADGNIDFSIPAWTDGVGTALGTGATLYGVFSTGDEITCTVMATDGEDDGTTDDATVTIDNTLPTVSAVTVLATTNADGDGNAATAIAADELECTWTFEDIDGGSDQSVIEWTDETGSVLGSSTTLSGSFIGGDTVTCMVLPNDGFDDGTADSASIAIGNTAPVVSAVVVTSITNSDGDGDGSTAVAADTLECAWTYDDVDGDPDISLVEWTDGVDVLGTGATLAGGFVGGETITCNVTAGDGFDVGNMASAMIDIDNTAPSLVSVSVRTTTDLDGDGNNTTANSADTLECVWAFDDIDGDSDGSTLEWTNGGVVGTDPTLSGAFVNGDTVTCTVTPNDGQVDGAPVSDVISIGNTAPSVTGVGVHTLTNGDGDGDDTTAVAADTLECTWTFDDPDGGSDNSWVEWYVGATLIGSGPTIDGPGVFFGGDDVQCVVTPNDGSADGTSDSASIAIDNSAPTVTSVAVVADTDGDGDGDEATAIVLDTLRCDRVIDDIDGPGATSSVEWFDDATDASLGTGDTLELWAPGMSVVKHDTVRCTVTPYDGSLVGAIASGTLTVSNAIPEVTLVEISALSDLDLDGDDLTAGVLDSVQCMFSISDADVDPDMSDLEWLDASGGPVGSWTGVLVGDFAARDDVIGCRVTPDDGEDLGLPVVANFTVGNTPPTVTDVQIIALTDGDGDGDPSTVSDADTLACSGTYNDADFDVISYAYEWSVGASVLGSQSTQTGGFVAGETVTCTLTPLDPYGSGVPGAVDVVIGASNTAPSVSSVSIDPSPAYAEDHLNAVASGWFDNEGDPEFYVYEWTVNWNPVGGNTPVLDASYTAVGDTVQVTITPDDGLLQGSPVSSSIITVELNPCLPIVTGSWTGTYSLCLADARIGLADTSSDAFGQSVASAGDVNGDGYDDLLIGAFSWDSPTDSNVGKAYLVLGSDTMAGTTGQDITSADLIFENSASGAWTGYAVASAGDVDGDGLADVLIGAPGQDSFAGVTYLIFGSALTSAMTQSNVFDLNSSSALIYGEEGADFSGAAVASAGDVDGDGKDDILIGAPWHSGAASQDGKTYLMFGKSIPIQQGTQMYLSAADASFSGEAIYDESGYSVASAGDIDGDGKDDILIGAHQNDTSAPQAGAVYLVYASQVGDGGDIALGQGPIAFTGDVAGGAGGAKLAAADIDGDRINDIIIGAPGTFGGSATAGATYVFFGSSIPAIASAGGSVLSAADVVISGEALNDYSASSISLGDVDGDSMDDLLIGAYSSDGAAGADSGKSYLFWSSTLAAGGSLSATSADVIFEGETGKDLSGLAVSAAGDMDGDGVADLLIGATGYETDEAGRAYLLLSPYNAPPLAPTVAISPNAPTELEDLTCSITAPAVDADGDSITGYEFQWYQDGVASSFSDSGADETAVSTVPSGATAEDEVWTCEVWANDAVALGPGHIGSAAVTIQDSCPPSTTGDWVGDYSLCIADSSFTGENQLDYAGWAVSSAGDVDGDGLDDILVGAEYNDDGGSNAGKTYLFFGSTLAGGGDLDIATADVTIIGETADDRAGYDLAGVGDVDGDGYDDILLGAPYFDESVSGNDGKSYLFLGAQLLGGGDFNVSGAAYSFTGEAYWDQAGERVAAAGDVDGDGLADFLIGARFSDASGLSNAGRAYLILAADLGVAPAAYSLSGASVVFDGEVGGDNFGEVASAGDVDGDGLGDLLFGAVYNDDGGGEAGKSYVFLGKDLTSGTVLPASSAFATFVGEAADDSSGAEVSSAGDIDGDGLDDIAIGAPYNDFGGVDNGSVYVYLASSFSAGGTFNLSTSDFVIYGDVAGGVFGWEISALGDVDGDGVDDLLFGDNSYDGLGINYGRSYLFFGDGLNTDLGTSDADATFTGEAEGDRSGAAVASAGDVDGDGLPDLVIGAYHNDESVDRGGQAYLLLSPYNAPPLAPDVSVSSWNPLISEDIVCSISSAAVDPDGDTITHYEIRFLEDGVVSAYFNASATVSDTITVPASETTNGEVWTCEAWAIDTMALGPGHIGSAVAVVGNSQTTSERSCNHVLSQGNSTGDGYYWLDPDGDDQDVFQGYCDMTTDGGGWTAIINPNDLSQGYMEQFPVTNNTVDFYGTDAYGVSWGGLVTSGYWGHTLYNLSLDVIYDEVRVTVSGFYSSPSGGLGVLRIGNQTSNYNVLYCSDAWEDDNSGQSLMVGGTYLFHQEETDVVNEEHTVDIAGSTLLSISMQGLDPHPYTNRSIAELWIR
jgi:hypothetical protein